MSSRRLPEVTIAGAIACGMGLLFTIYFTAVYISLKHIFAAHPYPAPFPYLRFVIIMVVSAVFFVSGIFLLLLKAWARLIYLIQMVCWGIMGAALVREAYGGGAPAEAWRDGWIFYFVPAGLTIYLLTKPAVIQQFQTSGERLDGWRRKVLGFAIGSIFILTALYLSVPTGVLDESTVVGRMVRWLEIFIPGKIAGPTKTKTASAVTVTEPLVVERPLVRPDGVEIDFGSCVPHTERIGVAYGSTTYQIVGQNQKVCVMKCGGEIENPTWDGFLNWTCLVPVAEGVRFFKKTAERVDFSSIGRYCTDTPRPAVRSRKTMPQSQQRLGGEVKA